MNFMKIIMAILVATLTVSGLWIFNQSNAGLQQLKEKAYRTIQVYRWDMEESRKRKDSKAMFPLYILFAVIAGSMCVNDWQEKNYLLLELTGVLFVGFVYMALFSYLEYDRKKISIAMALLISIVFTCFLFFAGENQFAVYWIIMVPITLMLFFDLHLGTMAGLYFAVLIIAFFHFGLYRYSNVSYSGNFIFRFPLFYLCCYTMSLSGNLFIKTYQMQEAEHVRELDRAVLKERQRVQNVYGQMIGAISRAVDAKDGYTNQHSARVSRHAVMIGKKLGKSEAELKLLSDTALLHDIGKIGVDDAILNKTEPLDAAEYEQLRAHTLIGGMILNSVDSSIDSIEEIRDVALYHHERFDGTGYPLKIYGEQIPLNARIIAVADSIDAMNSDRVYRKRMNKSEIINELKRCRGLQFDPEIADIAITQIEENQIQVETQEENRRDTILVVNDMKSVRAIIKKIFEKKYNVLEAENGLEALAVLEIYGETISAILLDLLMPEMDGIQFLENIKKEESHSKIPVIILTNSECKNMQKQVFQYGVMGVIERPFDERIMKTRVENAIRIHDIFSK